MDKNRCLQALVSRYMFWAKTLCFNRMLTNQYHGLSHNNIILDIILSLRCIYHRFLAFCCWKLLLMAISSLKWRRCPCVPLLVLKQVCHVGRVSISVIAEHSRRNEILRHRAPLTLQAYRNLGKREISKNLLFKMLYTWHFTSGWRVYTEATSGWWHSITNTWIINDQKMYIANECSVTKHLI